MRKVRNALLAAIAALTCAIIMGSGTAAVAESDRTMGISCTVAGHEHCGETGGYWGHRYRHYRHYR